MVVRMFSGVIVVVFVFDIAVVPMIGRSGLMFVVVVDAAIIDFSRTGVFVVVAVRFGLVIIGLFRMVVIVVIFRVVVVRVVRRFTLVDIFIAPVIFIQVDGFSFVNMPFGVFMIPRAVFPAGVML